MKAVNKPFLTRSNKKPKFVNLTERAVVRLIMKMQNVAFKTKKYKKAMTRIIKSKLLEGLYSAKKQKLRSLT